MSPLELDLINFAQRMRLFDRAVEAAKARDDAAFREAMAAFWKQSPGSGEAVNVSPVNK